MTTTRPTALLALAAALLAPAPAAAVEWLGELETGLVWASRNDVRIPGDSGTRLSLVKDLAPDEAPYSRVRAGATLAGRHVVFATWAPVRLESSGALPRAVAYQGATFPAGTSVHARYVFDSYRLTYRYGLVRSGSLDLDLGATAFARDAAITLQGGVIAEKTNVGFVPLLSFRAAWRFAAPFALVVDGDALASAQGRAEDVLVALEAEVRRGIAVRAGYRVIEGGADNAEVYNFALLNHVGAGLSVRL